MVIPLASRPYFSYKRKTNLAPVKGRPSVTPTGGARAVPAGGGSSLPFSGGSWDIRPAGKMTGLRETPLDWDRKERVTPAKKARGLSNHRDRALRPSPRKRVAGAELRRSFAAASAAVERRQASAPSLSSSARRGGWEGGAPHPSMRIIGYAPVGVSPPFFFRHCRT